jgi:RNA polymerase sigma-70 factor (ECF subfamily)
VSKGDETAFVQLFNTYSDKLYSYIFSICGSTQVAEDIVQDVFLKIWQGGHGLASVENFDSYLFRMAHNYAINVMKRMARETLIVAEIAYRSRTTCPDVFSEQDHKEIQQLYNNAIEKMPFQQRLVFTMSKEKGLKQQEIASTLNISLSTVKSHMTQALRFLRTQSKDAYPMMLIFYHSVWLY